MSELNVHKISTGRQCLYSGLAVIVVALFCGAISRYVGYHVIAFVLLLAVSVVAMFFDIIPILVAALMSALVWDFFFIPPYFTFTVNSTEDTIFLLIYFVVAITGSILTYKIRRAEMRARAREEREYTFRLYNTLLNSLSHELRTPIATIMAATDNLVHQPEQLTEEGRSELLAEISKATYRLNHHVENLLNMSRLESGFLKPRNDWCDINELIYFTVGRIEENYPNRKIEVEVPADLPLANTDRGLLEQVIFNLLINAVIYTPGNSLIKVSASCNEDIVTLNIDDSGGGFPEAEIEKVFDKFYRLKNANPGGTGLGLSIVKGFVEALGGTVLLVNRKSGGASFTITLPVEVSYLKNISNE